MSASPEPLDEEPPAIPATDKETRLALWTMASELIVDLGYTYRQHLIVGQRMRDAHWTRAMAILRSVLPVAASAGTATFALFGLKDLAIVLGFGGAIVIALEKAFDPTGQANAHSEKGDRLLSVYKDLRYLRARIPGSSAVEDLERQFAGLRKRADDLRMQQPRQLPPYAYAMARKQIRDGQTDYKDDPLWEDAPEELK